MRRSVSQQRYEISWKCGKLGVIGWWEFISSDWVLVTPNSHLYHHYIWALEAKDLKSMYSYRKICLGEFGSHCAFYLGGKEMRTHQNTHRQQAAKREPTHIVALRQSGNWDTCQLLDPRTPFRPQTPVPYLISAFIFLD